MYWFPDLMETRLVGWNVAKTVRFAAKAAFRGMFFGRIAANIWCSGPLRGAGPPIAWSFCRNAGHSPQTS
jgi:hypothetical protein